MKRKADKQEPEPEKTPEVTTLKESLARTAADYANYRRRTEEQLENHKQQATKELINDLLDITDHLTLAINNTPEEKRDELCKGVELILGQLITILEKHGVERITIDEFDPHKHEAIIAVHHERPRGSIIEELQPGYTLKGIVLRTSKVKISKGPEVTP